MTGEEVYREIRNRGGERLFHANSVATSLSLLRLGGLASRGSVSASGLPQTNQITDTEDKEYGIWFDSFADTVDIHQRLGRRNHYGPVLFELNVELLLRLPEGSSVRVTRCNPTDWKTVTEEHRRYFVGVDELAAGLRIGDFGQMLVIRAPGGNVPFAGSLERIILDEPRLAAPATGPEFEAARQALSSAATAAGIQAAIQRRICNPGCGCTTAYQEKTSRIPYFYRVP